MRISIAAAAILAVAAAPLGAQATRDQARIAFSVTMGYVLPSSLWSIDKQPVADAPRPSDTLALGRRIRSNISFGFSGTYFPHDHLGLIGEAYLLGVGFEDSCHLAYASGSVRNREACSSIDHAEKASSAVAINAGVVYRMASRSIISPYARLSGGFLFSSQSSVRTIGQFPSIAFPGELADAIIYPDPHDSRVSPTGVLAVGFTSMVGRGYQLRWEVRDNITSVRTVTGATTEDGTAPPTSSVIKHLFSFNVGFDVVLERRRGHRY